MLTQRPPIHSLPDSYFDRSPYAHVSRPAQRSQLTTRPIATPVSTASRKRPRADPHQHNIDSYVAQSPVTNLGTSISSLDCLSPAPLANTDYFLSGGLDTPGAWSCQRDEHSELFEAEQDHRWNRFSTYPTQEASSYRNSAALDNRKNHNKAVGAFPDDSQSHSLSGWHLRKVAWAVTGGLAGKIINFCWNTTFRGFSAGGGPSYTTGADGRVIRSADGNHQSSGIYHDQRHAGPSPRKSSRPTLERSNTRSSWVFVERVDTAPEREHSPLRKKSRASIAGSNREALGLRDDVLPHRRNNSSTASFASPRAGGGAASIATPPTHSYTYSSSSTQVTFSPKRQRTSIASPTRRQSSQSDVQPGNASTSSQSSPEAEALKRQKRRDKRRQDESLSRFNLQLKDLIREGKQALGSKVEVIDSRNDYDMDEGCFVDDTDENDDHVL